MDHADLADTLDTNDDRKKMRRKLDDNDFFTCMIGWWSPLFKDPATGVM